MINLKISVYVLYEKDLTWTILILRITSEVKSYSIEELCSRRCSNVKSLRCLCSVAGSEQHEVISGTFCSTTLSFLFPSISH